MFQGAVHQILVFWSRSGAQNIANCMGNQDRWDIFQLFEHYIKIWGVKCEKWQKMFKNMGVGCSFFEF